MFTELNKTCVYKIVNFPYLQTKIFNIVVTNNILIGTMAQFLRNQQKKKKLSDKLLLSSF